MKSLGKKTIKQIEIKKPSTITRLIKCYVCNQHFDTQNSFDLHLKQHQSKLNRTNIQQIQRKTQESFRTKKPLSTFNKTQNISLLAAQKKDSTQIETGQMSPKEEVSEEEYEKQIQDALRQSKILLQKIQFMTQIREPQKIVQQTLKPSEQVQQIAKTIANERQLFAKISSLNSSSKIEPLILATNFQTKYFQNYQQQLNHLRVLSSMAINPASIAQILQIRKKICRDVLKELECFYKIEEVKTSQVIPQAKIQSVLTESDGQLAYCAQCYLPIAGSSNFFKLKCGHSYHEKCWEGECCG